MVRTFFTMEGGDSEFAMVSVLTLKAFLEACSRICVWQQARTCCLCYRMPKGELFLMHSQSAGQLGNDADTFFHPPSPFPCNSLQTQQ